MSERPRSALVASGRIISRTPSILVLLQSCNVSELELAPSTVHYVEIPPDAPLDEAFTRHATRRGRLVTPLDMADGTGSTDMGNVSQAVPGLHGMLDIDDAALPHTQAFELAAGSPRGDETVLDGAAVLAGIAAELFLDADLLA